MNHGIPASATADPSAVGLDESAQDARSAASVAAPRRLGRRGSASWLLLVAVLVVQALLSLRLVGANTAFEDEAEYLWAGHLEWAHWLHGAPVPPFAAYFSGAPVFYPPVGALADSLGGLAAARMLSLAFMLGATALLWGTAGRLFGRRAAFFAAALFAVLGPTLHLGAFATYDAMSMLLVALAAWCVVRAGARQHATGWMIAAGVALALANAAAYSTVLFDPIVILLLIVLPESGGRVAARRAAIILITVTSLLAAGLLIGGGSYLTGVEQTTLAGMPSPDSALSVLKNSWSWAGLIVVMAVCGVITSWVRYRGAARTWLLAVLTGAAVIGPLEQARLHTVASLDKHVGLGAWFAAIAAGYAADRFVAAAPTGRMRAITCGACVVALIFPVSLGVSQSRLLATGWPNASAFTGILGPLVDHGTGRLLVEDPSVAEYYLPAGRQWLRWSSTRNIVLPAGAGVGGPASTAGVTGPGNAGVYAEFITSGYFSVVALSFSDTTALDHRIAADLRQNDHYRIVEVLPYGAGPAGPTPGTYVIWRYEPHPGAQSGYEPNLRAQPPKPRRNHQ